MKNRQTQDELREFLSQLPDFPVSSNFTARVMQAIEREESRPQPKWAFFSNWRVFLPRAAVAAGVMVLTGLAFHHHEIYRERAQVAQNLVQAAGSSSVPSVEALKNFDVIQRMAQPQHADEELLALMQ
jgi:anti-sigma-K factor RskA